MTNVEKRTDRRKKQGIKKVRFIQGNLACKRCPQHWAVVDLNEEHKVVKCPACGEPNDIREAIKRAIDGTTNSRIGE